MVHSSEMIRIEQMTIGYPGQTLFSNLNLFLKSGELVCFMGPNGAGKSTLIRTIAGLQQPLSGTIRYPGTTPQSIQKMMSLVLTDPVKGIDISVYDTVTFGRYPYLDWRISMSDLDHEIIRNAIDLVNIKHLQHKKLHQLSDGQLQMVMIARAVAQDTPVIILDEPTAHLDLNNRVEIMRLLKKLTRESNKAILLATHELDLALQTADLIWLTGNAGNITTGIPEDLVLNGAFDETFKFKGFDLKTGKVQHHPFKKTPVTLTGHDHFYLWTKNALERNGYTVVEHDCDLRVTLSTQGNVSWILNDERSFSTLNALLASLPA